LRASPRLVSKAELVAGWPSPSTTHSSCKVSNLSKLLAVRRWALVFVFLVEVSAAADLDAIRATQQKLIAARDSDKLPRDEVPLDAVATAKNQLLRWAESRLQTVGREIDPGELAKLLHKELHDALRPGTVDDSDRLGDLDIAFSRPKGEPTWLQMSTDVGIPCGFDRSVYLYEWHENRWNRRFAMEANDYRKSEYGPQQSIELEVSVPGSNGARLVLATGWPPACMSVWHTLYIRLFGIDASQSLLMDEAPLANEAQDDPAYSARLEPGGALIEFFGSCIDVNFLIRKHVLHYALDQGRVRRIDPIALSPRDFVDEWLTRPWAEMGQWSEPQLADWHNRLHKAYVNGEFEVVQRCTGPSDWQISVDFEGKTTYFAVLDRGQNRFRMAGISENPRAVCSGQNELRN
jgi:hypothetical protein